MALQITAPPTLITDNKMRILLIYKTILTLPNFKTYAKHP